MPLHELVYVSLATDNYGSSELMALLNEIRAKNLETGITGLLVYHDRQFMQVLEGEKDRVVEVYGTIRDDPRHQQVHTLWDGEISERSFADWSMAFYAPAIEPSDAHPGYSTFLERGMSGIAGHAAPAGRQFLNVLRDEFLRRSRAA